MYYLKLLALPEAKARRSKTTTRWPFCLLNKRRPTIGFADRQGARTIRKPRADPLVS
jgi:hypothetical protein